MPESQQFFGEPARDPALFDTREAKKLPLGKVSGMRGHKIQELSLGAGITIALNGGEVFWRDVHSDKISCMISGSCIAGRSRAASSANAYMAKPAWAFATRLRWL